jgi:uncharacterized protein
MTAVIFFSLFFAVTGLITFYLFIRGRQAIPPESVLRHFFPAVFWFVALSYFVGRFLEQYLPPIWAEILIWIGSFWLGAMVYLFISVVVLDLLRLAHHFFHLFPGAVTGNYAQAKYLTLIIIVTLVGALLAAGHLNSRFPRVRHLDLEIAKSAGSITHMNIVMASDLHMGVIINRSRVDRIVNMINSLKPDLVLFPGDMVDEDIYPLVKRNVGESINRIESRYGTYAVTGNHEYIGGVEASSAYLIDHGVFMLRDKSVKIADSFYIVGREDLAARRFAGYERKDLAEIMAGIDTSLPVIVMDHQPYQLQEAVDNGVDLLLSGHTHRGQLWPFNHVVNAIFELAWGYRRISDTHIYVSNGVGTWGPPVRIGNRPEIVQINLRFQ